MRVMAAYGSRATRSGDDGYAVVVVLGLLSVLALAIVLLSSSTRAVIRHVTIAKAGAQAEADADAGALWAALMIGQWRADTSLKPPFVTNGTPVVCRLPGGGTVAVSVSDEVGKIDLNHAEPDLIRQLFEAVGLSAINARVAVARLLDYIDPDDEKRADGAEVDDYRAAGRAAPRNAPLASREELGDVLGFDRDLVAKIWPHVTVHATDGQYDPDVASPALRSLLPGVSRSSTVGDTPRRIFGLRVVATSARGGAFVREAVLDAAPRRTVPYIWREWRRGALRADEMGPAADPSHASCFPETGGTAWRSLRRAGEFG